MRGRPAAEAHLVYTSGEGTIFSFSLSCCCGSGLSKKASAHPFTSCCLCRTDLRTTEFLLSGRILLHWYTETTVWQLYHYSWFTLASVRGTQRGLPHQSQRLTAARMGPGIILKVQPLIGRCFLLKSFLPAAWTRSQTKHSADSNRSWEWCLPDTEIGKKAAEIFPVEKDACRR